MKKLIGWSVVVLLTIGILVSGIIGYRGYQLYQSTMEGVDIEQVVEGVRARDNYVGVDQIPNHFLNAIIAVEDHRFESHNGFDVIAFGRAVIRNLKENDFAAGGSTITQQLSKNLFFSFEKKLERKVAELMVSKQLEALYEKEEILELYVNIIYYGDGFEGIYDASMGYFKKHPKDLSAAESALLAGLPQAPSAYALFEHFDLAVKRSYQVVDKLIEYGYITETQGVDLKEAIEKLQVQ